MKIGIVPLSAKPFHAGHDGLVRLAAEENDEVHLYVSTSDRGEVSGKAMAQIWRDQIEHTLPGNVKVTYGGSPIGYSYKEIGEADETGSQDTFLIYSDTEDASTNFSDTNLKKYAPNMFASGRVMTRPVERTSTVDVSGTKMRGFLAGGDKKSFLKYLPRGLDGNKVWDTLLSMKPDGTAKGKKAANKTPVKKSVKGEALLRSYIRNVLCG